MLVIKLLSPWVPIYLSYCVVMMDTGLWKLHSPLLACSCYVLPGRMLERDWKGRSEENVLLICPVLLAGGLTTTLHPGSRSAWYSIFPHLRGTSPSHTVPLLRGLNYCCSSLKNRGSHRRALLQVRLSHVDFSSEAHRSNDPDLIPYPPAIEVAASCTCFLSYLTISFFVCLFYLIYLFWPCWVFIAAHRLSLLVTTRGYSLFVVLALLLLWSGSSSVHRLQ